MLRTLGGVEVPGLERSCERPDSIRSASQARRRAPRGLANGFEPHRHDTYGIGVTTAGVQTFHYRGTRHICMPGELHFLHPDETHDGGPATDDGFGYRIVYVAPELIHRALDGEALPFVEEPVKPRMPATRPVWSMLANIDEPISDLARVELAVAVADTLRSLGGRPRGSGPIGNTAVERVREYLAANPLSRRGPLSWTESPAWIGSRSRASSVARSARAPTGTARCAVWSWPGRRSNVASPSLRRPRKPPLPTRAT
jgi:hypothetical protein